MTEPYRQSPYACPGCGSGAPLREFQDRQICDECGGMLLAVDDFAESLREIDGAHDELVFSDEQPIKQVCPRCQKPMSSFVIERGKLRLVGTFARCAAHGIWFPRDAMTAVFARVSRRAHTFFGGRRGGGAMSPGLGMIGGVPGTSSGPGGAMASIAGAFGSGPASSGLAIGNWGSSRPRVHTLYVSAHKDKRLGCPSCKETALTYAGDRWPCETCAGSFVEIAALEAMISDVAQHPWAVPPIGAGGLGERNCPVCETKMIVEVLEAVTIDRCAAHGVWFDEDELQAALHHAIEGEPSGVGGWVKKLFHRHGTTE